MKNWPYVSLFALLCVIVDALSSGPASLAPLILACTGLILKAIEDK